MRVIDDDGNEVPRGDVGEVAIRGHNIMKDYWRREEATAEAIDADGWFKTGDIAKVDEDGYFFIVDRKKELVIRGGFNIYPREIEELLYEHPVAHPRHDVDDADPIPEGDPSTRSAGPAPRRPGRCHRRRLRGRLRLPSQFSREYRRMLGVPPSRDARALRDAAVVPSI
jgi:acyl-CoA synthetase (AMP-forming)/AMP-acid ligase II